MWITSLYVDHHKRMIQRKESSQMVQFYIVTANVASRQITFERIILLHMMQKILRMEEQDTSELEFSKLVTTI